MRAGKAALVTGVSRGVGKGIAQKLGSAGATVYVIGRSTRNDDSPFGGTVVATAGEVTGLGGKGIAVACDHKDDAQTRAAFDRIANEAGRLDILVNNATAIPDGFTEPGPFWSKPLVFADLFDVDARSTYVANWMAAPMLIRTASVVINISSLGSRCYVHGPAYGGTKAAVDKMAFDMTHDFKPHGLAVAGPRQNRESFVSRGRKIPGPSLPSRSRRNSAARSSRRSTPTLIGGKVFYAAELAQHCGVEDKADLIIVDRNPLTCAIDELPKTQVLRTVFDGADVFDTTILPRLDQADLPAERVRPLDPAAALRFP